MKSIWKFPLKIEDRQTIKAPILRCLRVGLDPAGDLCLWVKVDDSKESEEVDIRIYGTGHPLDEENDHEHQEYLGSVNQGQFVWHVFEHFHFVEEDEI